MGSALLERASTTSLQEAEGLIESFLKAAKYQLLGIHLEPTNTWYRARVQRPNDAFRDHLSEFLYPLKPATEFGRLHCQGQRMFYAAWNQGTAIAEVKPGNAKTIWMAHARPWAKVYACLVGAYEYYHHTSRTHYPHEQLTSEIKAFFHRRQPPENFLSTLYADSVLAKLLRSPSSDKYHLTSAIGRVLMVPGQPTVFLYPSVQTAASINVAIPEDVFDAAFEVMAVERHDIEIDMGSGIVAATAGRLCHDFSNDGHINWYSLKKHKLHESPDGHLAYSIEHKGWRVPLSWEALKSGA